MGDNMRFSRPVTADVLFESPEMKLRYPGEIEVARDGSDEGAGRGFDDADQSAGVERTIAAVDDAGTVGSWFVDELTSLGWTDDGDGWFSRDEGESFLARVDLDHGVSRIAELISGPDRLIQERSRRPCTQVRLPAGPS